MKPPPGASVWKSSVNMETDPETGKRPDYLLRVPSRVLEANGRTIARGHRIMGMSITKYLINALERQLAADSVKIHQLEQNKL